MGDNCPKGCKHETFHYCQESGTHCDTHCVCPCQSCVTDRRTPAPYNLGDFGKILPGAIVISFNEGTDEENG